MVYAILFKNSVTGESAPFLASELAERCMQKGLLLVHTGRESIKLGPPLTISRDALIEGIAVIREALQEITS